jgi:hypothetical protein
MVRYKFYCHLGLAQRGVGSLNSPARKLDGCLRQGAHNGQSFIHSGFSQQRYLHFFGLGMRVHSWCVHGFTF